MGEGYPQSQEQQLPAERRDEPDADTRWDHDKAETMAAVLKDEGTFDNTIEQKDAVEQEVNSKEYLDRHTEAESNDLKFSQEHASEPADARSAYGFTQAERERNLEKDQRRYDTAVVETRALGEGAIEKSRQRVEDKVDQVLSPYQELYDRNQSVFAEMPTAEFMGIAKEFSEISSKIKENEADSKKIEWWSRQIKDAFEKKGIVNWNIIDALEKEIGMSLEMDDDTYDEVLKKFEAEVSDSFDKTPRQIMEGYMRVAAEYTAQFEDKKQADKQRKKELLDKYGPEASDQGQN